jgi:23S rRNA pseudouridine1911/1915/1917 synthase
VKTTIKKSLTLIDYLKELYPDSPRTRIKKLLQSGTIRINSTTVTLLSYLLKPGDVFEIDPQSVQTSKAGLPFPVLFEDQYIIVIEKPPGISTSSTDGSISIQWILSQFLKKAGTDDAKAFVVHRLDKEVSGALLFAKSHEIMNKIKDNWKETEKHYYALVEGVPGKPEDTVKSWLAEDKSLKMHSVPESDGAKFSVTSYKILKVSDNHALLDVNPETGRKNQIRVHLADIGCPIVGDRKYGASSQYKRRVRLHAYSLSFPHPVSGETIRINLPLPKDFLSLKARDEHYK